tara:strand:+ start:4586 stop:5527 length:942 start_codon:yes stop_codon:yes gene_type:complete
MKRQKEVTQLVSGEDFEIVTDISECEKLWKTFSVNKKISDMWEFKFCFHKYFNNLPHFIVHKKHGKVVGMLPLSYDNEQKLFKFFPGDDDWIEKNSIFLHKKRSLKELIKMCPANTKLTGIDEIPLYKKMFQDDDCTYSLYPKEFNYNLNNYHKLFKRKHVRNILRDLRKINKKGVDIIRCPKSYKKYYKIVKKWSVKTFGDKSYFYDKRFVKAFSDVLDLFMKKEIMYMTVVKVDDELAAIDFGCIYGDTMTVFAGGVNPKFRNQGIAKFINMEHIKYGFDCKLDKLEFLAFNFNWKEMWHLKKEKLFKFMK